MRLIIPVIFVAVFLPFCSSDLTDIDAETLRDSNQELFFSAVYYLPGGPMLFESPASWFGEPPASFNERLSEDEQEQIIKGLNRSFSTMGRESKRRYIERFNRWVDSYRELDDLNETASTEEVLAAAYETGHFDKLFQPLIATRDIPEEEFDSIEIVSMFASSENITLFYRMAQELSMLSEEEASGQIADIRRHLE
jgi:hypothetical protein